MKQLIAAIALMVQSTLLISQTVTVQKSNHDIFDQSSIRAGAKQFLSQCMSCHDVSYLRYSRLESDLDWPIEQIEQAGGKLKDIFMLGDSANKKRTDLSLLARVKGADWLYTYIKSNVISKNQSSHPQVFNQLDQGDKGKIATDLTDFLVYAAEPIQAKRRQYGYYVIVFLLFFLVIAILLKNAYWKQLDEK